MQSGLSGRPTASVGFSLKAAMRLLPAGSPSMTPKLLACDSGTRTPATVTEAPVAMCCSSIWRGSMR